VTVVVPARARRDRALGRLAPAVWFVASLVLLAAVWELYKAIGPAQGGRVVGMRILPRTEDAAMPHVWDMLGAYTEPELRGSSRTILSVVAAGAWFTLRIALAGLAAGVVVGMGLAIVMARFGFVRRALLPYVVLSQTVPLIALAPLVVSWGGRLTLFGVAWQKWMSAAAISAFLAFFPVSVGALRGLLSPSPASLELMDSYAAGWFQTLVKLRLPASLPFLIPALKLAASAAVIGTIVAEISTGLRGGIGRLVIEYSREGTSQPAKVFTALFAAAALGLVMAGLVTALDTLVTRHRPKEMAA
jgi:NitT/TauT family transport system permease protein